MRQLFLIQPTEKSNVKLLLWALDREDAKRAAHRHAGGNMDKYIVTPLTNPGDRVHFEAWLHI